ncbi:Peptidase family M23 [Maribacter sedimenticola]|uniref:Peptidase family M23 n=1 Tax=Maribacter sedimenticola TaxID=228956 RepID=A0ABY1SKJ8_9FLAO|nr:peptidoglycan DD-metalloendopeptidase family protein [Maribacter sedimenticola]SNR70752.1 Peptidase family M23 [Maribacter sedimenticola]
MDAFIKDLISVSDTTIQILDKDLGTEQYVPLDLSKNNVELYNLNITEPTVCQDYIDKVLDYEKGSVAFGGYLEERNLYNDKESFTSSTAPVRNIHLGIDFWCQAHTKVMVPIDGIVHSFKFNNVPGDYGPTIVLQHSLNNHIFYTLYGHLSLSSLDNLKLGKAFYMGEVLGVLGTPDINVNYAPHLHFQIIRDMEGYMGDYPGVCSKNKLEHYKGNCPDPNLLLKF